MSQQNNGQKTQGNEALEKAIMDLLVSGRGAVVMITPEALQAKDAEISSLRDKLDRAIKQLQSCKAAMTYAYEDRSDQYYLNVLKDIESTLIGNDMPEND